MKWKGLLLLLGGLVFGILAGAIILQGGGGAGNSARPPEIGQAAPDFTLENLDGESVQLDQFRGKVVFLNFWSTLCVPCREEMPLLKEFAREQSAGAVVLGVNLDDPRDQVARFVEQEDLNFPVLLDTGGAVAREYCIRAYPTTIVINPTGKIVAIHIGILDSPNLLNYMRQAEQHD